MEKVPCIVGTLKKCDRWRDYVVENLGREFDRVVDDNVIKCFPELKYMEGETVTFQYAYLIYAPNIKITREQLLKTGIPEETYMYWLKGDTVNPKTLMKKCIKGGKNQWAMKSFTRSVDKKINLKLALYVAELGLPFSDKRYKNAMLKTLKCVEQYLEILCCNDTDFKRECAMAGASKILNAASDKLSGLECPAVAAVEDVASAANTDDEEAVADYVDSVIEHVIDAYENQACIFAHKKINNKLVEIKATRAAKAAINHFYDELGIPIDYDLSHEIAEILYSDYIFYVRRCAKAAKKQEIENLILEYAFSLIKNKEEN
jgi:hypothetical protein